MADHPSEPGGESSTAESSASPEAVRDPFSTHLAFVDAWQSRRARTFADGLYIQPVEPIDVSRGDIVDFDVLEALASWHGVFKMPRDKTKDELSHEVEEAMRECEPQFILRNIGRVERFADPDERLEVEHQHIEYGLDVEGARVVKGLHYEPPDLLEVYSLEQTDYDQRWRRWIRDVTPWSRHFGMEIKEAISGPQWRYDPYAPTDDPDAPQPIVGPGPPEPPT